jgi:DNA polymerase I
MVIIIDGNQLACRCYFTYLKNNNRLMTTRGKRTELIYGFLASFRKIVRTYKDQNPVSNIQSSTFFLTWDGGNDKRKAIYPQYKSGRAAFETAFYEQLDELRQIIKFLGIKQYHLKGVEADDLIGTLTIKARRKGKIVLIISSDHDFEQLISKHVKVLHPLANNLLKDYQWVLDNYGISPDRLVEVMSLTGDPTDHIPGIEKIGDKTAASLILANGTLDDMLLNIDNLKILNRKKEIVEAKLEIKQKIKDGIEGIKLARKLVQIECNLDIEPDFENQPKDFASLQTKYEQLEFNEYIEGFRQWEEVFG